MVMAGPVTPSSMQMWLVPAFCVSFTVLCLMRPVWPFKQITGGFIDLQVYRLGVFFPALLFGWMRERTGTVVGAAVLHACCNLLVLVLEASFY